MFNIINISLNNLSESVLSPCLFCIFAQRMSTYFYLTVFDGLAFIFFGLSCLFSKQMRREFQRYGLTRQRTLVGVLQLAGGLGVLIGITVYTPILIYALLGLFFLMVLGVMVRIRIRDPFRQLLPAASFALLNAILLALTIFQ